MMDKCSTCDLYYLSQVLEEKEGRYGWDKFLCKNDTYIPNQLYGKVFNMLPRKKMGFQYII